MMNARVVTFASEDSCVMNDGPGRVNGWCVDIWDQIMRDLNLTYSLDILTNYPKGLNLIQKGDADVFLQQRDKSYQPPNSSE